MRRDPHPFGIDALARQKFAFASGAGGTAGTVRHSLRAGFGADEAGFRQAAGRARTAGNEQFLGQSLFGGRHGVGMGEKTSGETVLEEFQTLEGRKFGGSHHRRVRRHGGGEESLELVEAVGIGSHVEPRVIIGIGAAPFLEGAELLEGFGNAVQENVHMVRPFRAGDLNSAVSQEARARGMDLEASPLGRLELSQGMGHLPAEHGLEVGGNMDARDFAGADFLGAVRGQHEETGNRRKVHGTSRQRPSQFLKLEHVPAELRDDEGGARADFPHQLEVLGKYRAGSVTVGIDGAARGQEGVEGVVDGADRVDALGVEARLHLFGGIAREAPAGDGQNVPESFMGGVGENLSDFLEAAVASADAEEVLVAVGLAEGGSEADGIHAVAGRGETVGKGQRGGKILLGGDHVFDFGETSHGVVERNVVLRGIDLDQQLKDAIVQFFLEAVPAGTVKIHFQLYSGLFHG